MRGQGADKSQHGGVGQARDGARKGQRRTRAAQGAPCPGALVGSSLAFVRMLVQARDAAPYPVTVLLLGASGTGKELLARFIHDTSRRAGPFLAVNCATLSLELAESELFGYERGAFTGATAATPGLFEAAKGGTLFLDEIGDLPLPVQSKLLRALQERKIRRVGGRKELDVDVRIIAATHRDLEQMVTAGSFRADLLYRLRNFPITLPSLKDRGADVQIIARHKLVHNPVCRMKQVRLGRDALELMVQYDWPGNVRELEHVLERAVVSCRGKRLGATHLAAAMGIEALPVESLDLEAQVLRHLERGPATAAELRTTLRASRWLIHQALSTLRRTVRIDAEGTGRVVIYRVVTPAFDHIGRAPAHEPEPLTPLPSDPDTGQASPDASGLESVEALPRAGASVQLVPMPVPCESAGPPEVSGIEGEIAPEEESILQLFAVRHEVWRRDVEALNLSRRTAARRLADLVERGLLERVGAGHQQRYRLVTSTQDSRLAS